VIVWTVNDEKMLRKYLLKTKVRGVITDDIALAKKIAGRE
jgi:glycerophosphoryl diester phosphodiesterase